MGNTTMRNALLALAFCTLCVTAQYIGQGADGNPHNWDRHRRCDHTDYNPPCGACEGYGGIPTGDENDQITLTTCSIVANASSIDPKTLKKPLWTDKWIASGYNEIIIGAHRDPFCFQVFPGNTSEGTLCYRHDDGTQSYDMSGGLKGPHTIYEDLTLHTSVGDVESEVLHQGQGFWVVNKFPWYAAGVHQCICTEAHEGGDKTRPGVYPVQFNWTQQMFYIGREKIGVEYGHAPSPMTLDHWAFGPHHVWSVPETGEAIRMWQPFNGLQVFPNGTNSGSVPAGTFDDIPPALCKKGGATFRIKCTDDGHYNGNTTQAEKKATLLAHVKQPTLRSDLNRAINKVPTEGYRGDDFANMSLTLNKWLMSSSAAKPCEQFSAKELQELQALLYLSRNSELDKIYHQTNDNRRLLADVDTMKADWAGLNDLVHKHSRKSEMHTVQRDGHCHQAVMWYVHHLNEDVKRLLAETGVEIPLLAYENHNIGFCSNTDDDTHAKVCSHYQETVTCASCHSNARP